MSQDTFRHNDCRNFIPVDVAKGICGRQDKMVAIDTPTCECFQALPKCKNCAHFSAGTEPGIGTCGAEPHKPWTYPELIAVTCEMYTSLEKACADVLAR